MKTLKAKDLNEGDIVFFRIKKDEYKQIDLIAGVVESIQRENTYNITVSVFFPIVRIGVSTSGVLDYEMYLSADQEIVRLINKSRAVDIKNLIQQIEEISVLGPIQAHVDVISDNYR